MRQEQVILPFFQVFELHIKSGADHSTLIQPACEVYSNFLSPVIIDYFKFAIVTLLYHHSQKQTMTLEYSLITTCHLPLFSALLILLTASSRTLMQTSMIAWKEIGFCFVWGNFFVDSLWLSIQTTLLSADQDSFISSFQICISFFL